jgi:tetratricopeptide (TPR) repeat protein
MRRRRLLGVLVFLLFACALFALIGASGWMGARAGTANLLARGTVTANAQVAERFQRGLDLLNQGNYALAEANFEWILQRQPDNAGVQSLLATARVAQTPTPSPTPTPVIITTDKNELVAHIRQAFEKDDWDNVINLADQLRALDSSFQRATVDDMRYQALVTRGLFRLQEGDIEAGLYDLDVAASIRDLDAQTESQRQMAALYQNALYYFGADWEKTIKLLSQVYAISPGYRDVASKLFEAYDRAGDAYAGGMDWCPAEKQYAGALTIVANGKVEQKHTDAQQKCLTATPAGITGTNGSSLSVQGGSISGRLFFAGTDPATGAYGLLVLYGGNSQANAVEAGGSQPAYQPGAGVIAYTLGGTVRGLYSNGNVATLGSGGGMWPSVSPDGTRVAYAAYENGSYSIYIAPTNGSSPPVKLTQGTYPVWGPAGRIAFQGCNNGQCGIQVMNPDQPGEVQQLTTTAGDISMQWSLSGNELVYATNYTGNWEIFSVTLGGQFRQLTNGTGMSSAPTWSPDGSRIAFESNRGGNWGIYVMNSDGSDARLVVDLGPNHSTWQTDRLAWAP